jgi:hypothetical protein
MLALCAAALCDMQMGCHALGSNCELAYSTPRAATAAAAAGCSPTPKEDAASASSIAAASDDRAANPPDPPTRGLHAAGECTAGE